jgi:hypothetical protein
MKSKIPIVNIPVQMLQENADNVLNEIKTYNLSCLDNKQLVVNNSCIQMEYVSFIFLSF